MKTIDKYLSLNNVLFFICMFIIAMLSTFIQRIYVLVPQIQEQDIPESLKIEFISQFSKYSWILYFMSGLIILARSSYVALCLYIGGVFYSEFDTIDFKKAFNVSLKADAILVMFSMVTSLLYLLFGIDKAPRIILKTSLIGFFNVQELEPWLSIILGAFNIFELTYWLILSLFISFITKKKYGTSFNFIISSYGIGFALYLLFLMFIVLYVSK